MAQFPHSFGKFAFPQSFHTRKLCEITLFYIVFGSIIFDLYHNLINHISSSSNRFLEFLYLSNMLPTWLYDIDLLYIPEYSSGLDSLREMCPYSEFFCPVFPHIWTRKTPNTDTLFSYWRVSLDGSDFTATNRPKKLFLLQNFP